MAAARYVALNPMRARLVSRAQDRRWSSVRAHLERRADGLVSVAPLLDRCNGRFVDLIGSPAASQAMAALRGAETIGRPLGSPAFLDRVATQTGRSETGAGQSRRPIRGLVKCHRNTVIPRFWLCLGGRPIRYRRGNRFISYRCRFVQPSAGGATFKSDSQFGVQSPPRPTLSKSIPTRRDARMLGISTNRQVNKPIKSAVGIAPTAPHGPTTRIASAKTSQC